MPGNVLNAKRVHFVAPVKMMISCYFAMTVIVVITCIVWYPPSKSHQKDLGVVICALQLFIRNNDNKINFFCEIDFRISCVAYLLATIYFDSQF